MRNARMSIVNRRRLLIATIAALIAGGVAILELWEAPPSWLIRPRILTVAALGWAHTHLLTTAVVGLLIGMAGLILPLLIRRLDQRNADAQQHRARDREVMLARVRNRWIAGVLD
jgi:hypothetical protein